MFAPLVLFVFLAVTSKSTNALSSLKIANKGKNSKTNVWNVFKRTGNNRKRMQVKRGCLEGDEPKLKTKVCERLKRLASENQTDLEEK